MTDDLTQLTVLLAGPSGTPYENGVWKLHLRIPLDYPKSPPKASFRTKIFHPNVEEATGAVCLDTLKRDWMSHLTLRDILITISCLLINPNPDSALNAAAGKLLQEDFDAFAKKARLMTSIHAYIPGNIRDAVLEAVNRGDEIDKDDESDYGDEASESKENDPSISPSPVSSAKPIQRNSILGKRPLADLPICVESVEHDVRMTISDLNVVANTPNLSSGMSSLSFDGDCSQQQQPHQRRIARLPHDAERINPPRMFTFTGISTSTNPEPIIQAAPAAKRIRTLEGKENEGDAQEEGGEEEEGEHSLVAKTVRSNNTTAMSSSRLMPLGLGLKMTGTMQATSKAKMKARIGLRRL